MPTRTGPDAGVLKRWTRAVAPLFVRKSVEELAAEAERSGLRRALGPLDLTAIGVAAIIGAGIFFLLGLEARTTGPAVMVSLLIGGVGAVLAALSYAELASLVPGSGSAYAYAYAALGRLPAFLMGWIVFNAYAVGNMAVAIGWSDFFAAALDGIGRPLPGRLAADPFSGGLVNLPAAAVMIAVTGLTLPRIRASTLVNNLLVGLKLLIVIFVIVFGALFVRPAHWTPFSPAGTAGVVSSAAVLFFAYLGFDTVAATAEESRRPRRDLPVGIIASVGLSMLLYIAMAAVVTGMSPAADVGGRAPVAAAFSEQGYPWASGLITAGALVALATVLYAFQLALARILYVMARDGLLPRSFARLHPTTQTPWAVTLWTGGLAALGAALLPVDRVVNMAVLASIFIYVLVAAGVLVLKWRRPDAPRPFRAPGSVAAGAVAVLLLMAFYGVPLFDHLTFWAWVGAGLMLYGFYAHRRVPGAATAAPPTDPTPTRPARSK